MRKALTFVCLCCLLVVGLACSGDSSTPTAPAVDTTSMSAVTAGVAVPKDLICHRNVSEPDGVVVEVSGKSVKKHSKHLASGQDCFYATNGCSVVPGDTCDPDDSELINDIYVCDETCF
jgi:hypothetical protein